MQRRHLIALVAVAALAATPTLSATASEGTGVGASPTALAAEPTHKQIARLKRQVKALKRQVARLRAENSRLRARVEALSPTGIARQLDRVRGATARYQSVDQARADGYAQASPCESSPQGGMGFHYVNGPAVQDPALDPMKPEVLLYAPAPGGGLTLVGVEYLKADADQNLNTDDDRPTLFGRAFDGPILGHAPGMPIHYDLHVWLHKRNPTGIFAQWNPDVRCSP